MKRTYIDANVLIGAFRGAQPVADRCIAVLDDPGRRLVVSDYLRLEVLPKPTFHKFQEEIRFMQLIFGAAENVTSSRRLIDEAFRLASTYNVNTLDALHVAAALVGGADEFVTLEKPTKPLFKIQELNVVSLYIARNV